MIILTFLSARKALIHPYFDSVRREDNSRETNTDQESISYSISNEINNAETLSYNKLNRLSQISKQSLNDNASLLSNSSHITNENKNLFMVKKYPVSLIFKIKLNYRLLK